QVHADPLWIAVLAGPPGRTVTVDRLGRAQSGSLIGARPGGPVQGQVDAGGRGWRRPGRGGRGGRTGAGRVGLAEQRLVALRLGGMPVEATVLVVQAE